ncbi:hypothetical protein [Streptomyces sp. ADMS]|uniref:hypothetical protein n=1 Tax=Streptomyces sp. ADMS TaxID=3071415 RepID=UPI0039943077
MCALKMHADEAEIDAPLVQRLISRRLPEWSGLPVERLESAGTENAMFRLGGDLVVRLPRHPGAATPSARRPAPTTPSGRGWAPSISLIQLPYYRETNPVLAANSRHVIREILAERG